MAARRLLILMLAVLAASTLGAALIAPQPDPEPETSATIPRADDGSASVPSRDGRLIEASVRTGALRPDTVRLRPGDQLELTVRSRNDGQVEIPRFGLTEDAGPGMPARFSLLMSEPGSFAVRLAGSPRDVARIEVSAPR
jgi:FtsP/CotA-like multicopper oxidase with cupredoxin domain